MEPSPLYQYIIVSPSTPLPMGAVRFHASAVASPKSAQISCAFEYLRIWTSRLLAYSDFDDLEDPANARRGFATSYDAVRMSAQRAVRMLILGCAMVGCASGIASSVPS